MLGLNLWQELEMIAPSEIPELKKRLMKLVEIRNQTVHGRDPVVENWKGGLLATVFTPLDRLVRLIAELVAQYSESVVGRNSHG